MPIPISLDIITGIINPDPTTRTQQFNMVNFTAVPDITFEFGHHHANHLAHLDCTLNNLYSESLEADIVTSLFTDVGCTAFKKEGV